MPSLAALPSSPSAARASGRVLVLQDMITGSRWGWHPASSEQGKFVWAEFAAPTAIDHGGSRNLTI